MVKQIRLQSIIFPLNYAVMRKFSVRRLSGATSPGLFVTTFLVLTFTTFPPALLRAQNAETLDTATLSRIRTEALQHSQIPWISHQLTDVAGPRLTNSPGWHYAADWIVKTLKSWGLSKAAIEPWGQFGYGWSAEKTSLSMRTPYYSPLIAYASPWSGSTNGPITAPAFLVEQPDSEWIAAHLPEMKGKILLAAEQITTVPPRFHADAERYSDSDLTNIKDMYMMTRESLAGIVPYFKRMSVVQNMIRN